jgi:hypothetical protein
MLVCLDSPRGEGDSTMLRMACLVMLLGSMAGSAAAAPAPPQLRSKNITVSATFKVVHTAPDGRIGTPEVAARYVIYVSDSGRSFFRSTRSINNPNFNASQSIDIGPGQKHSDGGETREMHFEGGELVGTAGLISGAGRMVVSFDAGYASCSARIIFGRAGGAPIKMRGLDGVTYEIQSVKVTSQTCAIRDGNPFAK